ncbi:hypothetical protein FB45DRAFT_923498 [Roridomyces roridus]|uniref:Uncharacterized protein n=1 Tax=Roridomyces roridus TaxID=1738132 RepID=A0AAD7FJW8_9AGAR|nr:hypothetical protein FB45DRAFT_923498 [Roridomyces roridus]
MALKKHVRQTNKQPAITTSIFCLFTDDDPTSLGPDNDNDASRNQAPWLTWPTLRASRHGGHRLLRRLLSNPPIRRHAGLHSIIRQLAEISRLGMGCCGNDVPLSTRCAEMLCYPRLLTWSAIASLQDSDTQHPYHIIIYALSPASIPSALTALLPGICSVHSESRGPTQTFLSPPAPTTPQACAPFFDRLDPFRPCFSPSRNHSSSTSIRIRRQTCSHPRWIPNYSTIWAEIPCSTPDFLRPPFWNVITRDRTPP